MISTCSAHALIVRPLYISNTYSTSRCTWSSNLSFLLHLNPARHVGIFCVIYIPLADVCLLEATQFIQDMDMDNYWRTLVCTLMLEIWDVTQNVWIVYYKISCATHTGGRQ